MKKVSISARKLSTTKCLITSDEIASQDEMKNALFPADFLEEYEILDILGKVCS